MSVQDNAEAFRNWATTLMCPPEAIPSNEALKNIFKTRQCDLLLNMMRRVQVQQEVEAFRENDLIRKMKPFKDQLVPLAARNQLPKELQTCLKVKNLQQKQREQETCLLELSKQYDELSAELQAKNMQSIQMEQVLDTLQAKVYLMEFKADALKKDIAKENQIKERIISSMPVKITSENASETAAVTVVDKAVKQLEEFYQCHESGEPILEESKDELWRQLRTILSEVPNFLLFKILLRLKEEQLQHIIELNKPIIEQDPKNRAQKNAFSQFELKMLYAKIDLFAVFAKYLDAHQERIDVEQEFASRYVTFANELEQKVKSVNTADNDKMDEVISAFIVQYNMRNFTKAENEFLSQQIQLVKDKIASNAIQLEQHEFMLSSIKQVYADIDSAVQQVQHDMLMLHQIKEKIMHSKNILNRAFGDIHNNKVLPNRLQVPMIKINDTVDSFEIAGEDVLCSTQLDMELSFAVNQQTLLPVPTCVPAHLLEVSTFAYAAIENFSCIKRECAFYCSANPLVFKVNELSSSLQTAPAILLTPHGALQELRNQILWAETIASHSSDLKMQLKPIKVDANAYKARLKQQNESLTELLDKINTSGIITEFAIQKLEKMYKFIMENPLRHCIPNTKRFNGQTYEDYEQEYNMYYRLVMDAPLNN